MSSMTMLELLRDSLAVDLDSMDPTVALRHPTIHFGNMTSNQAIVHNELIRTERRDVLDAVLSDLRSADAPTNHSALIDRGLDLATVLLAKDVFPHITGYVLAQTSPSAANDTAGTVAHAKRLVALFGEHGIPRDRVCIKIPTTPECVIACNILKQEGINTLGTCLFSLPQALAAAQAGCLCISPYYHELRVHFDPALQKGYTNSPTEHAMCGVIQQIIQAYKAIGTSTLVMPARHLSSPLCDPTALRFHPSFLTNLPYFHPLLVDSRLPPPHPYFPCWLNSTVRMRGLLPFARIAKFARQDYLFDGGSVLRGALSNDAETQRRLNDALQIFAEMEEKTRSFLQHKLTETA